MNPRSTMFRFSVASLHSEDPHVNKLILKTAERLEYPLNRLKYTEVIKV